MKTDELKNLIKHEIEAFVAAENEMQLQPEKSLWQKPLVGFADAKIIIAYFVPFRKKTTAQKSAANA